MEFILGVIVGFLIRHILWYREKRRLIADLFKKNEYTNYQG